MQRATLAGISPLKGYPAALMAGSKMQVPAMNASIVSLRQRKQAELRLEIPFLLTVYLPFPPSAEAAPASLAPAEEEGAAGNWGSGGRGVLTRHEGWTNEHSLENNKPRDATRWLVSKPQRLQ